MKKRITTYVLLPFLGLALLTWINEPNAATIGINVPGSQATIYYEGAEGDIVGYLENKSESNVEAFVFDITALTGLNGFSESNEANAMNEVAGTSFGAGDVLKSMENPAPNAVKIHTEYFSMKPGGGQTIAFFRNTTGAAITLTWSEIPGQGGGLSHYSQYGPAVPVPAAAYLFGSALIGLAGIGYRRKS